MRALLDTHTFLWWNAGDPQLSDRVREIIALIRPVGTASGQSPPAAMPK